METHTRLSPPFTADSAAAVVATVQEAWRRQDADAVIALYDCNCAFRQEAQFLGGRAQFRRHLIRTWERQRNYQFRGHLCGFDDARISARIVIQWWDPTTGYWFRAHANTHWDFNERGLICSEDASINDYPIPEPDAGLA